MDVEHVCLLGSTFFNTFLKRKVAVTQDTVYTLNRKKTIKVFDEVT